MGRGAEEARGEEARLDKTPEEQVEVEAGPAVGAAVESEVGAVVPHLPPLRATLRRVDRGPDTGVGQALYSKGGGLVYLGDTGRRRGVGEGVVG